jgi:acyl-homoserine-lactone acylase
MSSQRKSTFHRTSGKWALCALALAACGHEQEETQTGVELRLTEYGIAHVRAHQYRALGFGQGYAQARDNLCKIELGMLGFKGQLSRHFGPDAPANSMAMSAPTSQISDLYFKGIVESGIVEELVAKPAPLGPRAEVRQLVRGYVDGFNALLAEAPPVECAGAEWLEPMTELDVYRRVYAVTTLMDQTGRFSAGIVTAERPVTSSEGRRESGAAEQAMRIDSPALPGSNAVALGGDITESGGGINLANPHLSWSMDMRWSVAQLTIPGKLDVSGAALIGVPLVVMGHTASVGWSITTAEKTRHHTLYELVLADDSPTTYLVDGEREAMQPREVTIDVKRPDGALEQVTHTQWWTRYGPVLGVGSGLPLPWNAGGGDEPGRAYALADVNRTNMRMLNTLFAFNHARSSQDILDAIRENQGVPWWTVVAADAQGQALLSQIQVVPNVPDAMFERCITDLGRALFASQRFAVLDGSRSDCGFQTDADAVEPGIFGPGDDQHPRMPFTLTRDYVENSNDSHWLPSADGRIDGMPRLLGDERSQRSLRTRGLIAEVEEQKTKAPYTRQILADAMLSNRSYAGDLVLDQSVALCRALPDGKAQSTRGDSVDVRAACEILAAWDHAMDADSRGALLFSSFWVKAFRTSTEAEVALWKVPFDPADPVHTPNTLDAENPLIARALADAIQELEDAKIPLSAALGDHQYVVRRGERIPIGGGTDELGVMNALTMALDAPDESPYGSGYMHVVAFDGTACPDAVTLLSYSQSSDKSSPHYADQTELYSQRRWVRERFCESAIQAPPELEVLHLDTM